VLFRSPQTPNPKPQTPNYKYLYLINITSDLNVLKEQRRHKEALDDGKRKSW